jgi:hypothetical protein
MWEAVTIRPVRTISRKPKGILRDCTLGTRGSNASPATVKVQSDPHGDMRSQAEMTWPRQCEKHCRSNNMPKVAKFLVG